MLSLIVAISTNGVIGRGDDLPWRLSADLRRFKRLTMGHHIVMGRKTHESIGRELPGRTSVVVTRSPDYHSNAATDVGAVEGANEGIVVVHSLDEAIALAEGDDETFIIGGAEIYRQALPLAGRLYVTRVHADVDGDVFFPEFDLSRWRLLEEEHHEPDEKNAHPYSFQVYER